MTKNHVQHSRTKHIEIKHHFIGYYGVIDIQFIDIDHQWVGIFTNPLTIEIFDFIKMNLNMHFVKKYFLLMNGGTESDDDQKLL